MTHKVRSGVCFRPKFPQDRVSTGMLFRVPANVYTIHLSRHLMERRQTFICLQDSFMSADKTQAAPPNTHKRSHNLGKTLVSSESEFVETQGRQLNSSQMTFLIVCLFWVSLLYRYRYNPQLLPGNCPALVITLLVSRKIIPHYCHKRELPAHE